MRPEPQHSRTDTSEGAIIYLGDVRRRRNRKRRDHRTPIAVLVTLAILCWTVWASVLMTVAPARLVTYLAFFLPLSGALVSTGVLLFFAIDWRRGRLPEWPVCGRRAVLATTVIVVNLSCLGARLWLVPLGAATVAAAVMGEVALSARG
ncbi:MAG: hypothetical protein PVSMB7_24740 [Chloroflexota bacterium]